MLSGIDVSRYQITTPALGGLAFAFVRAGFGSDNPADAKYALHAADVRAAGLPLGAYWFWYDGQDNASAVAQFLAVAGDADMLALDLEGTNHGTASALAQARDFIDRVHATGRKIGLYGSASGFPDVGQDWNWIAQWTSTQPSKQWTFWQYGGSPIDRDKFNGDAAALAAFVADQGDSMTPAPILDHTPAIVDIPAGESQYALDAATKVGLTLARTGTLSPFSVKHSSGAVLRAIFVGDALFLAAPTKVSPVPAPVPSGITQADVDAAVSAQAATDAASLNAAVAEAKQAGIDAAKADLRAKLGL